MLTKLARFLGSDEASYVNGQAWAVDGQSSSHLFKNPNRGDQCADSFFRWFVSWTPSCSRQARIAQESCNHRSMSYVQVVEPTVLL